MKEKNLFLSLVVVITVMITILFTNIGYANENFNSYSNSYSNSYFIDELNVEFNQESKYLDDKVTIIDKNTAVLDDIVLNQVGEYQIISIPIINKNMEWFAKVQVDVFNSNTEYFKVSYNISKLKLAPNFDEAILEIQVELIKEPLDFNEITNIKIDIISELIYSNN